MPSLADRYRVSQTTVSRIVRTEGRRCMICGIIMRPRISGRHEIVCPTCFQAHSDDVVNVINAKARRPATPPPKKRPKARKPKPKAKPTRPTAWDRVLDPVLGDPV